MDNITIRKLNSNEPVPYDLLLLADPSMEMISGYMARGDAYIAVTEDEVVGIYVLLRTRPFTMELVNVAVGEKHQGRGIGKQLVLDAINRAKQDNTKLLEVGTGNSSIMQLALYQKCGFRITGVEKDYFKKHYKEDIVENGIRCVDMIRLGIEIK